MAKEFDQLSLLAGRWSKAEAKAFADAVAPFSEIDVELWTVQPHRGAKDSLQVFRKTRKKADG